LIEGFTLDCRPVLRQLATPSEGRAVKSFAAIAETIAPLHLTGGRLRDQFKKASAIHFAEIVGRSRALRVKDAPARFGRLEDEVKLPSQGIERLVGKEHPGVLYSLTHGRLVIGENQKVMHHRFKQRQAKSL
jgi:hypothetical protein